MKIVQQVFESKTEVKKLNPPERILNDIEKDWISYGKNLGFRDVVQLMTRTRAITSATKTRK